VVSKLFLKILNLRDYLFKMPKFLKITREGENKKIGGNL